MIPMETLYKLTGPQGEPLHGGTGGQVDWVMMPSPTEPG